MNRLSRLLHLSARLCLLAEYMKRRPNFQMKELGFFSVMLKSLYTVVLFLPVNMPFLALYVLKEIIYFEEHVSSRNLGMDLVSVVLRLN